MAARRPDLLRALRRWALCVLLAGLALQLLFVARIAAWTVLNPASTAFERAAAWQLLRAPQPLHWRQQWVDYAQISDHLKRAVIASEDDGFVNHDGVDWAALEKAWQKNAQAQARAERQNSAQAARTAASPSHAAPARPLRSPKVVGGSTISQQLAKNLLLSGERNLLRKGQELVLTFALEALLSKQRILEIYLNHVEWGEGVFGAEAAAQRYYKKSARALSAPEAARLAVMLPRPKFFERLPQSAYVAARAETIMRRMPSAVLP